MSKRLVRRDGEEVQSRQWPSRSYMAAIAEGAIWAAIWRSLAETQDALARDSLPFLRGALA